MAGDKGGGGNRARPTDEAVTFVDRVEVLAIEVADWRATLEVALAGAILNRPAIGLLRADECGVTAGLFEREDARCMYLAAVFCGIGGRAEDKSYVLAMARRALVWGGWWLPDASTSERGMWWSERNLVSLACGADGPAEVVLYAGQLIDLDRRQRRARRCLRRATGLLDGWGKVEVGGKQ